MTWSKAQLILEIEPKAAKKAYVNFEIDVDADGNVKFTKHEKNEGYVVEK